MNMSPISRTGVSAAHALKSVLAKPVVVIDRDRLEHGMPESVLDRRTISSLTSSTETASDASSRRAT